MGLAPLYGIGQRDRVYGILPFRWWESRTGTDSATTVVTANFEAVERQYVLLLTGVAVKLNGSSGQYPLSWVLETANTAYLVAGGQFPANNAVVPDLTAASMRIEHYLVEGEQLRVRTRWDAGVTNNTITASIYGFKIPRGNMQGALIS